MKQKTVIKPSWGTHQPAVRRWKPENLKFQASLNYRDPVSTKGDGVAREITASEALALQECGLDVCSIPRTQIKRDKIPALEK